MRTFALLVGLSALVSAPVSAEPESLAVSVLKNDLSTEDGRKRIRRQIADVIEKMCRSYASVESYQFPEIDECRRRAKGSAEVELARAVERGKQVRLSNR